MKDTLYLLTGATGLLGGNIIRELDRQGKSIRALVLCHDHACDTFPSNVEIMEGNILDPESLDKFFYTENDADIIVIHAAGIVSLDPRPSRIMKEVNIDGTKNIVDKCIQYHVKKLVYISSTSVIPELPHGHLIRETRHFDPDQVVGYYSKTKTIATKLVMHAVRTNNLNASIIYPSGIFGPNDYNYGLITSSVKMVAEGKLPVSIGGTFNSVDARDLAAGIISCTERGKKGHGYIMASRCYTFDQLVESICNSAGIKKPRIKLPLWFLRPFAGLGSLYGKITHTPSWFSWYTIYNLKRNNNYSTEKAKKELRFTCRPLKDSITDTLLWLEKENKEHFYD